jgi:hypothetical protein
MDGYIDRQIYTWRETERERFKPHKTFKIRNAGRVMYHWLWRCFWH